MTHILPLTSLRFFAAAAIVIFHMKDILPWDRPGALSQGVSFFFVLSGFILTYAYGQRFDLGKFYLSRFARLWPVHLFCLLLAALLLDNAAEHLPAWVTISNLTMTQAWIPVVGVPFSYNGPSWSISCEMAFYLAFPLLVRTRHFWPIYIGLAVLAFGSLAYVQTLEIGKPVLLGFLPIHFVLQHPIIRILEFATGVAAGRLFISTQRPSLNWPLMELAAALALLLIYWLTIEVVGRTIPAPLYRMWYHASGGQILFAFAIIIFAWSTGPISKALSAPFLVMLGEISFSTYMLHQIVIRTYLANDPGLPWYLAAAVILVLSYGGSWLLFRIVETPARGRIVSFGSKWRKRKSGIVGADSLGRTTSQELGGKQQSDTGTF